MVLLIKVSVIYLVVFHLFSCISGYLAILNLFNLVVEHFTNLLTVRAQ